MVCWFLEKNLIKPDTPEFYSFLCWYRDKLWLDEDAEGWEGESICQRILDVIQSPHKFEKEMKEYLETYE